jgi:hypothetical protein
VGFEPLTDHEIDAKIIRHCRGLEHKHQIKPVYQVQTSSRHSDFSESDNSEYEIPPMKSGKSNNQQKDVKNLIRSIKLIAENTAKKAGEKQFQMITAGQGGGAELEGGFSRTLEKSDGKFRNPRDQDYQRREKPPKRFENQKKIFPPPNPNFMKALPQKRMERKGGFQKTSFRPQGINQPTYQQREGPRVYLAAPRDAHYMEWVNEAKNANQIKYMGQKIKHDFENATNNFKEMLKQTREPTSPAGNQAFYIWKDGKYSVDHIPEIDYPVMRKVGNGVPQLSTELMKRFNKCCYACGSPNCPRKGRKAKYQCAYQNKADSWMPCERCKRGFHLKKDCMALLKN